MSPSAAMAAVLSPLHSKFSFSSSAAGGAKPSPTNSLSSDADTGTVVSLVAGDAGEGLDPSADLQAYVADAEKGVLSSAVAYRCWGDQWQAGWQGVGDTETASSAASAVSACSPVHVVPQCPLVEVRCCHKAANASRSYRCVPREGNGW